MSSADRSPGLLRGFSRLLSRQREALLAERQQTDESSEGRMNDDGEFSAAPRPIPEPALLPALWSTGAWRILPYLVLSILGEPQYHALARFFTSFAYLRERARRASTSPYPRTKPAETVATRDWYRMGTLHSWK
jgi:hypothetical protein